MRKFRVASVACLALATFTAACKKEGNPTPAPDMKPKVNASGTKPAAPADIPAPPDVAAAPADAEKTPSGLASKVLTKGTGTEKPNAWDAVKVHYTGWTTDGKMFDSSVKRGEPAEFGLDGVIKGWTEGLQLMVQGEKRRFWIPAELAYGDPSSRPGAPAGMLVFDIELLGITKKPAPPKAPDDVAAPPADATKTASGLASKVLTKGTGKEHPRAWDVAKVHYTGWTTDGKMFDSSVTRGEPAEFPLNKVIKGWTEGLQLMVQGEKRRFWIPVDLAYKNRPGKPAGMLVFDVELLGIDKRPEPPKTPDDLKKPPASATKTASGLISRVLTKGTGKEKPGPNDRVEVHFVGWMSEDGQMVANTYELPHAESFVVSQAIAPGFTEAIQLMVEGEKRRVWMTPALATKRSGGPPPPSSIVFDFELVKIDKAGATAPTP